MGSGALVEGVCAEVNVEMSLESLYFVVIRVWSICQLVEKEGIYGGKERWRGINTVVGRALRRSADCSSHDWVVFRYGILEMWRGSSWIERDVAVVELKKFCTCGIYF